MSFVSDVDVGKKIQSNTCVCIRLSLVLVAERETL